MGMEFKQSGFKQLGCSPCASCKLLRRRCAKDCIFSPYFPPEDPHKFASVHKVFGASNVSKMLQDIPVNQRGDAVSSLVYEANARLKDPVYGCVGAMSCLDQQVRQLQMQLALAQAEIVYLKGGLVKPNDSNSYIDSKNDMDPQQALEMDMGNYQITHQIGHSSLDFPQAAHQMIVGHSVDFPEHLYRDNGDRIDIRQAMWA